jgi:hypothetical protein
MLDQSTRAAMLKLHEQGHSIRGIARALKVSRGAVRDVRRSATETVPALVRPEKATPYRDQILELYARCRGNLVRVHEELVVSGAPFSYPALTAFCRRQGIGHEPKEPIGEYHFQPGQEMQHDTSPHRAEIGGHLRPVQTASLVCAYSRMLFFQFFPTFRRFDCKVFLTDALQYFQGACETCLIDNTHVVVLKGTGREMVPVPEMAAFADRYGFRFQAHAIGNANRSARVERSFRYIETNFLAGRSFPDWADANRQARQWCDKVNARFRDDLKASPRELFAAEQAPSETSPPLGASRLSPPPTPGGSGRVGLDRHQSLFRPCRPHRTPRGSAPDQRPDRNLPRATPRGHTCPRDRAHRPQVSLARTSLPAPTRVPTRGFGPGRKTPSGTSPRNRRVPPGS